MTHSEEQFITELIWLSRVRRRSRSAESTIFGYTRSRYPALSVASNSGRTHWPSRKVPGYSGRGVDYRRSPARPVSNSINCPSASARYDRSRLRASAAFASPASARAAFPLPRKECRRHSDPTPTAHRLPVVLRLRRGLQVFIIAAFRLNVSAKSQPPSIPVASKTGQLSSGAIFCKRSANCAMVMFWQVNTPNLAPRRQAHRRTCSECG
jgi:hypothetical protein